MQMHLHGKTAPPARPYHRVPWLLLLLLCSSLSVYGQSIRLSFENAPLEDVFRAIEQQSDYRFIYTREELSEALPVTVSLTGRRIEKVLDRIFAHQPLSFTIHKTYISVHRKGAAAGKPGQAAPAPIDVQGRVLAAGGQPLAGASVSVFESTRATATDGEGRFFLAAIDPASILQISSIGYTSRDVPLSGRTSLTITLQLSVTALDEAVVIAYGTVSRRHNTGSVSRVSSEAIGNQPVANPLAALHGRAAGVTVTQANGLPGSAVAIQVRGRTSINAGISNEPLFIIDGVPYAAGNTALNQLSSALGAGGLSPFNTLNPADIESIEILKDADATAIYGSRGANGVVLITTKKGRAGKTRLEASLYTGWSRVTRTMDMLHTKDYLAMRREALANDGLVPSSVPSNPGYAPDLMVWDTTRYTDFKKRLIGGTARTTNAQASLSGGSAQTQFLVTTGYNRQTTVFPGDFANSRATLHTSLQHATPNRRFTLALKSTYAQDNNHISTTDLTAYINLPPNLPPLYEEGGQLKWQEGGATFQNPLAFTRRTYHAQTENGLTNLQLSYLLARGLTLRTSLGHNSMHVREISTTPIASQNPALSPTGNSWFGNKRLQSVIVEPDVSYQYSGKGWKLNALVGGSWQQTDQAGSYVLASGYTNDLLLKSMAAAATLNPFGSTSRYRYAALFGRLNTVFKERYLLNVTARRDGSSRFGPEQRYATFGAVGGAWIFTREPFLERATSVLSFGKLRGSYGVTGNDKIGDYGYLETYQYNGYTYQGVPGLYPTGLFNPDYAWELNRKLEAALELGFLKDRLLLTTAWYRNRSSNQLIHYQLPAQTGGSGITANFPATVQNEGLEVELSFRTAPAKRRLRWQSAFNLSFPQNRLIAFPGIEASSYARLEIGHSLNIYSGLRVAGVDPATGLFQFYDQEGKLTATPTAADRVNNLGSLDPDFYGGWTHQLAYGSWEVDAHLEFKKGRGKNYLNTLYGGVSYPGTMANQPEAVLQRWQQPGDVTAIQRFTSRAGTPAFTLSNLIRINGADFRYGDASFVRLKNLSLAYRLPEALVKKTSLSGARLFVQGQNLLTLTAYKGADPETQELYRLPPLRTIAAGIHLTF